jgi:hypothetical protein
VYLLSVNDYELVTFPNDLGHVEEHIREQKVRLLVIDPVVATLAGDLDSHRDHSIRRALAPLAQLAERCDIAVVAVMHFSKRRTADLLSRVGGSVGFGGAARSVIVFVREPDDEAEERPERVIVHAKANWGCKAGSLSARVETAVFWHHGKEIKTSRLRMLGPSCVTAADLAADSSQRSEIDAATEFLLDALADGDWHEYKQIDLDAKRRGIARATLYRAAAKLGEAGDLKRQRIGFPAISHWQLTVVAPASRENSETTGENPVTTGDLGTSGVPVISENALRQLEGPETTGEGRTERAVRPGLLLRRWRGRGD